MLLFSKDTMERFKLLLCLTCILDSLSLYMHTLHHNSIINFFDIWWLCMKLSLSLPFLWVENQRCTSILHLLESLLSLWLCNNHVGLQSKYIILGSNWFHPTILGKGHQTTLCEFCLCSCTHSNKQHLAFPKQQHTYCIHDKMAWIQIPWQKCHHS